MSPDPDQTVEECLREIRERTALLRYLASAGSIADEIPDPLVLAGMADICEDVESLARRVQDAIPVRMLDRPTKYRR